MHAAVVANTLNLTTPVGWLIAKAADCRISRRDAYWEATGYRWSFPRAGAFTVGCVVISRRPIPPRVWEHEKAHVRQYALLGPLFWPAYALATGWSLLRTGDHWSRNMFERQAGLSAGGYAERAPRRIKASWRWRRGGSRVAAAAV